MKSQSNVVAKNDQPRIALFGGTFDPVHSGHLAIAEEAHRELDLTEVRFLPCRQSPHKERAAGASDKDRLAMLKLATAEHPWAVVDSWELDQPPPSYSWKTAEHFSEKFATAELFWLMGADQWQNFAKWARPDHLARLAKLIVHSRNGGALDGYYDAAFLHAEHPASSTAIRDAIAAGKKVSPDFLPPAVGEYIEQSGLYMGSIGYLSTWSKLDSQGDITR